MRTDVQRVPPGAQARLRVKISGAVQGVGFRPFVWRLATELGLRGWVINDAHGVQIEAEGGRPALAIFLDRLPRERPPHAVVQAIHAEWGEPCGHVGFVVRTSARAGGRTVAVLPDLASCPRCLAEIAEPAGRHYRYPFTNCTHCGPRFSILQALPYDRANTSMRGFRLCPACEREYRDPRDRRFHAQPTACPACGPQLALLERTDDDRGWHRTQRGEAALAAAATAIRTGRIAAVKGLGGFQLFVDAGDDAAVLRLRARKRRPSKPLALMVADVAAAARLCHLTPEEEALLAGPEAPIVLLRRLSAAAGSPPPIAAAVAPGNPGLGLMLPATPLHHLLLALLDRPVVATSGNLSDEPICVDDAEATARLGGIADVFLVHDRPIVRHVDDSVTRHIAGAPQLLRRARGYAPLPVLLPADVPPILAVGGHLKNTVALGIDRQAFLSQHIGDLATPQAFAAFERVIADFLRLYAATPVAIACDLHPDYRSSRWAADAAAQDAGCRLIPVQHHHAHFAACLAEHGHAGEALGVIWDGAGYGPDGHIWGGEALLGSAAAIQRFAHLRCFPLPGGDAAAREPRRSALALLFETFGEAAFTDNDLAPMAGFTARERHILAAMLTRGLNTPSTSSMGRLFDGVAALAGLHQRVDFEGEAAMALEFATDPAVGDAYPIAIAPGEPLELDWRPLIEAVVTDVRRGRGAAVIGGRLHNALVDAILAVAAAADRAEVVLSGGCFQNRLLAERATARLAAAGHRVLLHRQVPTNDGGISLGQLAVAAARLAQGEQPTARPGRAESPDAGRPAE